MICVASESAKLALQVAQIERQKSDQIGYIKMAVDMGQSPRSLRAQATSPAGLALSG
jgi:hypothetical protein